MSLIDSVQIAALSRFLDTATARQKAVTTNIANLDTPGYSRQRADLQESAAIFDGQHMFGTGVELDQIVSLRDRVLNLRIQDERQNQGALQAQVSSLQDIEPLFSSQTENLNDAISKFFGSISDLSTNAASVPLRQAVLISAEDMTARFRSASTTLQQRQFSLDLDIQQAADQVNQITSQIAYLNSKIAGCLAKSTEKGSFEDQRDQQLEVLSNLIGNQVILADDGLAVTTQDGTPLVLGGHSTPLTASRQADGSVRIFSDGQDITDNITGGKLGGLITARQQTIPAIQQQLDTLAASIATAVNTTHLNGTDLNGDPGTEFFVAPAANGSGAAAGFKIKITDPRKIAASLDGTAGDNANLNAIFNLETQPIVQGDTPSSFYAKIAFGLGSQISNASSELAASEAVAEQLNNQRGAISGVSLDEEAANLIRYQRAYEAAARVLTVISDLTEISVNLGR